MIVVRWNCALSIALVAAVVTGCGSSYSKETVPVSREVISARVPNQQRLLALAVDDAVERLDFSQLAGKRVITEIAGIYPHSPMEALTYIRGAVEGKLSRSGAVVLAGAPSVVSAEDGEPTGGGILQLDSTAEYRVIINVSWAGVDTHHKKRIDKVLATKQYGLMIGGPVGGLALGLSGEAALATIGSVLMIGGLGGGLAWRYFEKPEFITYRLMGRVRLSAEAIPLVSGKAFQTIGEGQTEIVVDPQAEEGYLLVD